MKSNDETDHYLSYFREVLGILAERREKSTLENKVETAEGDLEI